MGPSAVAQGCPLVALRGLSGGAGTTSLALALACEAAAASGRRALVAETAGQGLETVAGIRSPLSLHDLACVDAVELPGAIWASVAGARILTSAGTAAADEAAIQCLLEDARQAHSLVVLDCGRGSEPPSASHTVWVAPASAAGLAGAARQLERGCPGVLAVVAVHGHNAVRTRDVRRLARERCRSLVLVAHQPELLADSTRAPELLRPAAADLLAVLGIP